MISYSVFQSHSLYNKWGKGGSVCVCVCVRERERERDGIAV